MAYNTIWETEEERKQKQSAPLQGIQYRAPESSPAPLQAQPYRPGVTEQLGTMYVTNRAVSKDGWIDKGWDYGTKKVGEGVDYAKANMSSNPSPTPAPLSADAQNVADLAVAENSPTAGMVSSGAAAPLAATPVVDSSTQAVADLAVAEMSPTAGMVASEAATPLAEGAAEGAIEGSAGSMAGPLAGLVTYAKTGDEKKAIGSGAGAYAGAIAGSAFGPVGTFIGSALGSYIGSSLF